MYSYVLYVQSCKENVFICSLPVTQKIIIWNETTWDKTSQEQVHASFSIISAYCCKNLMSRPAYPLAFKAYGLNLCDGVNVT